ncbi:siderophore-interacting protein [Actinobacteria bacterium YIM 96077]|uniref:Siderophore-interacting protein n=1 Tax=Phytoactinopolyspora halophila TaxID=1981511 RepID=A0A329QDF8_9ACTN|nr:siderophore-interacting protein [Phytoactinopolyspora halophila]AYY15313.1 siderophore-interacting protein [Actinobacteria bacterium YIM 96077]RAW09282.1 siderophore-interacting protein [Phytoactinopolyspora halophila]
MAESDRRTRRARHITRLQVVRTEWLTPHMVRVVAGGPGFADFVTNEYTDRYVKLLFLSPDVEYPNPMDIAEVRASMPPEHWPVTRTYTVRYVDTAAGEIAIDFVLHGDSGIAAPWAASAQPGDEISFFGPSGAYAPSPHADWHLLAGDEAALPAIASALEAMPDGVPVHVIIEVADAAEELPLPTKADATITWLHRDGAPPGDPSRLIEAVKADPWLPGTAQVFVHGEAGLVKGLRRYFLDEREVPRELLSLSGYWRAGMVEDDFQAWKKTERARGSDAILA